MTFIKEYRKHKLLLVFIDFVLIHVAFALALKAKYGGRIDVIDFQKMHLAGEWVQFIPFSIIMILYFQYANLYKYQNVIGLAGNLNLIFKSIVKAVLGYVLYQFATKNFAVDSRLFYIFFIFSLSTLLIPVRMYFVRLMQKISILKDNIVIIGTGKKAGELLEEFTNKASLFNVVGFIDDRVTDRASEKPLKTFNNKPVIGTMKDAKRIVSKYKIHSFILAFDDISRKRFFEVFEYFRHNGLALADSTNYLDILHKKHDGLDIYNKFNLVTLFNDRQSFLKTIKRRYDVLFALLGLIILSPVFFIISILIKLSSPGPIIYSQERVGKNGKSFKFYKFRSMLVGSESDKKRLKNVQNFIKGNSSGNSNSKKVVNKENITKVGVFIRKHSLDELPQLLNVLKGDMSLVGPRPCLVHEWEVYEDWQQLRLLAMPGCTGMWQVYGRSEVTFEESVLMDIYYSHNFNPLLDIKLILKTIPVMLFARGGE